MKKNILLSLVIVAFSTFSLQASFSEKQIDEMVKKMNFQENDVINTDVPDPFGYPAEKIEKKSKKKSKKLTRLKTKKQKAKKNEKKIIINYQGIIINKALINGKSYKLHDYFNDSEIIKITPNQLYLKQNDFIFIIDKTKNNNIIKEK